MANFERQESDRAWSHLRFYCDDDRQDLNGNSRWKLREDPPEPYPAEYIPQRERPRAAEARRGQQYQEWVDNDNQMALDGPDYAADWAHVQTLGDLKEVNASNYVFFALLARLADYGWRLNSDETLARAGLLERDESLIVPDMI
ncbi:MAG: hypothetical protein Q9227_001444 [Pyrenula ochraceoflavens]